MLIRTCLSTCLCLLFTIVVHAQSENPAAPGFNVTDSDAKAIQIADEVMKAMGGRQAWDRTRYIHWTFFGRRTLLWDKKKGAVRIDFAESNDVFQVNLFSGEGRIWLDGKEQSHPDTLAKYTQRAKSIWINDAYWLVMPFKLKDSGVTLKHLGEETKDGITSDVIELTFAGVGDTPENRYEVLVGQDTHLVNAWRFYTVYTDEEARFETLWTDYQRYGDILLSGNRGRGQLTDIAVFKRVPKATFKGFEKGDPANWKKA